MLVAHGCCARWALGACAGFFNSNDAKPQLLVAPSSGPQAGKLIVYSSSGCGVWASAPSSAVWLGLELVDINHDGNHDVLLASMNEVSTARLGALL